MDPYIKKFQIEKIKTEVVSNSVEANQVLKINQETSNFKLLHTNIRSISKNLDEFKIYLQQFDFEFECIVFTETWAITDLELYQIDGYKIIYNEGNYNQNDGTAIYIKSDISFSYNITKLGNNNLIHIDAIFRNKLINIACYYRPPSTCPHEFNTELQKFLESHSKLADYYIFVGDINIDILKNSDIARDYLNTMHEYGYISIINDFTRCKDDTKSCIDHMFLKTRSSLEYILPLIIQTSLTDHYTITVQIIFESNTNKLNSKNQVIKYIDTEKLKLYLSRVSWNDVYISDDLESATNKYLSIIRDNAELCTKTIKIKHNKVKRKVWITNGIINSINTRDRMNKELLKDPNNMQLKLEYINYRNTVTKVIKKAKIKYYRNKINQNKNSSKHLWETVKELCNTKKQLNEVSCIKNSKGQMVKDPKAIADVFNENYITMGKKLADNIIKNKNYKNKKTSLVNSLFLKPTDKQELQEVIRQLKNNKGVGIDGMKAETLKHISNIIAEPLVYIVNTCMEKGHFPSALKTSIVIPIYKNGDRHEAANYRPISLITNFAKVFEKIIKNRLNEFIKKYKILSNMQYGFREGKSTQDAILSLTSRIYTSLDENKPSLAVFIDLAKAFDTVSHTILMETLEQIGIRNNVLNLFKSYISDRYQCVKVKGTKSDFQKIEYGVPQGTILGPLLFIIYLNGLFSVRCRGTIITYADDTAIYYTSDSWSDLKTRVETDMCNIKDWFDYNLLTINFQKTYYLPFCTNQSTFPNLGPLKISGTSSIEIQPAKEIKYLGVILDCNLKWDIHINYIVKKVRTLIYKFKKLSEILETKELKTLYYSLVESHFTYALLAWGGAAKSHLKNIELIQKRVLKIILKKDLTYPTEPLLRESGLLDIRQLYYYHSNIKHYKENYLLKYEHIYNTRKRENTYIVPFMRKSIGQKSFSYLGPKLYNTLTSEIKNSTSVYVFKKKLNIFINSFSRNDMHNLFNN